VFDSTDAVWGSGKSPASDNLQVFLVTLILVVQANGTNSRNESATVLKRVDKPAGATALLDALLLLCETAERL